MEKKLKELIKKRKKYYYVGIEKPDVGTKHEKVEVFNDGRGYIIFNWEKSTEFIAFSIRKKAELPAMSFSELTPCREKNPDIYCFDGGDGWKITIYINF